MVGQTARQNDRRRDPDLIRQIERPPFENAVGRNHDIGGHQTAEGHQNGEQEKSGENSGDVRIRSRFGRPVNIGLAAASATVVFSGSAAAGTSTDGHVFLPPAFLFEI